MIPWDNIKMEHAIVLKPEILGYFKNLPVTNTLLVSCIAMTILTIISLVTTWRIKAIPAGLQNFFELIVDFGYRTVEDLSGSNNEEAAVYS